MEEDGNPVSISWSAWSATLFLKLPQVPGDVAACGTDASLTRGLGDAAQSMTQSDEKCQGSTMVTDGQRFQHVSAVSALCVDHL